jgi:hypothetical protein
VGNGPACLHVSGTGRGTPRDEHAVIFEPFVQLDRGLTRTAEGRGLAPAGDRFGARRQPRRRSDAARVMW